MAVPVNGSARWMVVAALSTAGLLLTGCSGEGGDSPMSATSTGSASPSASSSEATGGDSGSPSSSPSASPTGSYEPATSEGPAKNVPVPEMPEAVKEPTEEGAAAAVEFWWEADNYLKATGDVAALDQVSTGECALCQSLMDRWAEIYELGGWAESGLAKVEVQFVKMDLGGEAATGSFVVSEAPGQIYQPNGELGSTGEGTTDVSWTFSAAFDSDIGAWRIDDIGPQQ